MIFADVSEKNDFNFNNIKMYSTNSPEQHLGTSADTCAEQYNVYAALICSGLGSADWRLI